MLICFFYFFEKAFFTSSFLFVGFFQIYFKTFINYYSFAGPPHGPYELRPPVLQVGVPRIPGGRGSRKGEQEKT